ncbi:hypothetical protein CYMTET_29124 [Cymbomonas tetramitiformis]|uniref:Uncharacterized protein n=1 Tax=Cymbomonas tetramitiformis TaxID=36881 RepID=A0AAE0FLR2_9CHLO|nr:hypothetical protein CYMTET_29124 [Cymbomonas tetramitiformis]
MSVYNGAESRDVRFGTATPSFDDKAMERRVAKLEHQLQVLSLDFRKHSIDMKSALRHVIKTTNEVVKVVREEEQAESEEETEKAEHIQN